MNARRRIQRIEQLIDRYDDRCFYCGTEFCDGKQERTIDHSIPMPAGGDSSLPYLRLACAKCNWLKGSLRGGEYLVSDRLRARRQEVEAARARAEAPPKGTFSHRGITFTGPYVWTCADCGNSGPDYETSPAVTPYASLPKGGPNSGSTRPTALAD